MVVVLQVISPGDFNVHIAAGVDKLTQDFLATITSLSQVESVQTHPGGGADIHLSSFCSRQGDLEVGDLVITPLSWADHYL